LPLASTAPWNVLSVLVWRMLPAESNKRALLFTTSTTREELRASDVSGG
jgi:hypothetical protein